MVQSGACHEDGAIVTSQAAHLRLDACPQASCEVLQDVGSSTMLSVDFQNRMRDANNCTSNGGLLFTHTRGLLNLANGPTRESSSHSLVALARHSEDDPVWNPVRVVAVNPTGVTLMKRAAFGLAVVLVSCLPCRAQEETRSVPEASLASVRERISQYVATFNEHNADEIGSFWTDDCVWTNEQTGERTSGRETLVQEFARFFQENEGARLTGDVEEARLIRPDVCVVEGQATLFLPDADPNVSAFTAVLVKEGDQWLISSSHERNVPEPPTPYDALRELEWFVGTWEDQTEGARVTTTVRWSANRAFLIRSFTAEIEGSDTVQGTQVIGWDPLNKQIRSWTFNSDGSFGEGTVARHDDSWTMKMWQILSDGRLASGTSVLTVVDDNTITVQKIGETVDGEPSPAADPVTVVRIDAAGTEARDAPNDGAATPAGATP